MTERWFFTVGLCLLPLADLLATAFGLLGSSQTAALDVALIIVTTFTVLRARSLAFAAVLSLVQPVTLTVTYGIGRDLGNIKHSIPLDPTTTQFFATTAFLVGYGYICVLWLTYSALRLGGLLARDWRNEPSLSPTAPNNSLERSRDR